jgi:hypothetical protein
MACNWSTPDGWTSSSWSDFASKNPDMKRAAMYIQSSSKRRQQRDIYLKAVRPNPLMIDGHVASAAFTENRMTGEKSYAVEFDVASIYTMVAHNIEGSGEQTFSGLLITRLRQPISNLESNIRAARSALQDKDPYFQQEIEVLKNEITEMEKSLATQQNRLRGVIDQIKALDD